MKTRFVRLFILSVFPLAVLRAEEQAPSSIKFSHPDQPEIVRIHVAFGSIKVTTNDTPDTVVVETSARSDKGKSHRADGLRVIGSSASSSLEEQDNVVEIRYGMNGLPPAAGANFNITVPRQASVQIADHLGADTTIEGVQGDVEVKNVNGEVTLTNLTGGVLVESINGQIRANFAALSANKALSFSSINGQIELRVPPDAKANVRFRTQNGSILTDFPDNVLVTKTESDNPGASADPDDVRAKSEASKRANAAADAARAAAREAKENARKAAQDSGKLGAIPVPQPIVIPSVVGGKVISGTLNGGGVDLQAATMNGDIVVRHGGAPTQ